MKRAEIKAYHKKYYQENKQRLSIVNKRWAENHKEKVDAYNKMYRESHKEQHREYSKQWYKKKGSNSRRIKKYGIDNKQYNRLLKKQEGKCAICGNAFKNVYDTNIDHNHETKKVRGLLCNKCNLGIGLFRDNDVIAYSAYTYLRRNT